MLPFHDDYRARPSTGANSNSVALHSAGITLSVSGTSTEQYGFSVGYEPAVHLDAGAMSSSEAAAKRLAWRVMC
jgi:hypothetical protein